VVVPAQVGEKVHTIAVGQAEVQHQRVVTLTGARRLRGSGVGRPVGADPVRLQAGHHAAGDQVVVFHQQYAHVATLNPGAGHVTTARLSLT